MQTHVQAPAQASTEQTRQQQHQPEYETDSAQLLRTPQFEDGRPEVTAQLHQQSLMANSPRTTQLKAMQAMMASSPRVTRLQATQAIMAASPRVQQLKTTQSFIAAGNLAKQNQQASAAPITQRMEDEEPLQSMAEEPVQREQAEASATDPTPQDTPLSETPKPNNTGLPDQLKTGIENLSGISMDHVKVHYNSDKPAQLQAHAYAQGSEIHVAPGQEQHLPHEAWHVVQQAQGRVKPTVQMKADVPVNNDVGSETEADLMGEKAILNVTLGRYSNNTAQKKDLVKQLSHVAILQRAAIPNTDHDTSDTAADASLIAGLSVTELIDFWNVVYGENAENAMAWRLEICGLILDKLSEKTYGDYDRSILSPISAAEVNTGLLNKTPLGAGEIKGVSTIDAGGRELVAARMQGQLPETRLTDEVSMIQILGKLGVRVPTLYGAKTHEEEQPVLPRDAQGKLNMLMAKVNSSLPALIVYDMGRSQLAPRLTNFLEQNHGNEQQKFLFMKTNMLHDLTILRDVYQVLAISDLEILIEDDTGHICSFDPGAIVPAGEAGDAEKEINTRQNLIHACEQVAAFPYTEQAANPYAITHKDAIYIGEFAKQANRNAAEDLLIRINYVLKRVAVSEIKDVTVSAEEVRGVIEHNKGLEDLGELVEEADITGAIDLIPAKD